MELGVPKVGQNRNQVVSGKGDLTGKMAMFGGFVRNVPQKIQKNSMDVFKILLQDQSDTSHAVSQLDFFSKYTGRHVVAVKSLFLRPKMESKYLFQKILFADFIFNF